MTDVLFISEFFGSGILLAVGTFESSSVCSNLMSTSSAAFYDIISVPMSHLLSISFSLGSDDDGESGGNSLWS